MTRKHYKILAEIFRAAKGKIAGPDAEAERLYIVHEVSAFLADDNMNFDAAQFIEACNA